MKHSLRRSDSEGNRLRFRDHDHHGHLTPFGGLAERPKLVVALVVGLTALAVVASIDDGSALDTWDVPIQEWVERNRTERSESFFRWISRLGSNRVIFPLAGVAALMAWPRCRPLSRAVVGAVALRPLFEYVIKDVVGRPRPDLDRLVDGVGFSHPSGHVLATVTLYSLLPAVVALYLGRRRLWWSMWAVVAALAPLMAACRVFLGVHWTTDATAGLLWGAVYLAVVELAFSRHHATRCGHVVEDWIDEEGHPHLHRVSGEHHGPRSDDEPGDVTREGPGRASSGAG